MTKTELEKLRNEARVRRDNLTRDRNNHPDVVEARKRLVETQDRIWEEFEPAISLANEAIDTYERQLRELRTKEKEAKKRLLPPVLEAKRLSMMSGVNYGPQGLVPIKHWGERFMLLKRPGHTGWSGRGQQSYYPTEYTLHDMNKHQGHGLDLCYKTKIKEWAGTHHHTVIKEADTLVDSILKEKGE